MTLFVKYFTGHYLLPHLIFYAERDLVSLRKICTLILEDSGTCYHRCVSPVQCMDFITHVNMCVSLCVYKHMHAHFLELATGRVIYPIFCHIQTKLKCKKINL